MRFIRDSRPFAYGQGFLDYLRFGGFVGRTHPTDLGWNEAYDRGRSLAESLIWR